MQLHIFESSAESVRAGYECPCGCRPSVVYERAGAPVHDGCCCGNEFVVGPPGSTTLGDKVGYRVATASFEAPWGETVGATWLVGPSVHADASEDHHHGNELGQAHPQDSHEHHTTELDPVCGMSVDPVAANATGLSGMYGEHDYYFCGRGCKLEFDDDPDRYLDPAYVPLM